MSCTKHNCNLLDFKIEFYNNNDVENDNDLSKMEAFLTADQCCDYDDDEQT